MFDSVRARFLDPQARLCSRGRDSRWVQSACAKAHRGSVATNPSHRPDELRDAHAAPGITDWDDLRIFLAVVREHVPDARFAARFDSMLVAYHAVRAGLGIAFLPCALGDADPALRRVLPDLVLPGTTMWLLTHPDLRRSARVRCFLEFMAEAMSHSRDLREGRRPLRAIS
jgi:DNA-binding transcriptional LysR family regulator